MIVFDRLTRLILHLCGGLNASVVLLLVAAFAAIRTGRRTLHARLMLSAIVVGGFFLAPVVPLVLRTVQLARRGRFSEHLRIVRFTNPTWMYVSLTGVLIYRMNLQARASHPLP